MEYQNTPTSEPMELAEPAVAYGAERRAAEPRMSADAGYGDDYFDDGEPLPDGWEDELANDPEHIAELERRLDRIDAEMAAGTLVTYTTEEVFDSLKREFPHLWGL